ncbi:hypothetical protein [Effusibacillus lacus]|uniref:Uncharacterized protein n=1 Tax=Effusibacillus lacus TaxID=1348429 RepID=A0A292YM36_9BACL|nr:hypothetical protein [Effusibacillus lacus]TCS72292.1 spore germination protein GerPA/GerPF [Effusibacillus lacus]GAX90236.1 hypothetical protein EFBL_1862 [Effusibacillus lacus]
MPPQINMQVQNGDIQVGYIKINAVSNSAVVILGDAETITPTNISSSRGVLGPLLAPITTPPGSGSVTPAV